MKFVPCPETKDQQCSLDSMPTTLPSLHNNNGKKINNPTATPFLTPISQSAVIPIDKRRNNNAERDQVHSRKKKSN